MVKSDSEILKVLTRGIPDELPEHPGIDTTVPHAPVRKMILNEEEKKQALKNALRYFPKKFHKVLGKEFFEELNKYGHIYMYRFRPIEYEMKAFKIQDYPGKIMKAKCMMFQIMNNLDRRVAQYPNELITYGGNGTVFSNWAQYLLTMKYLCQMEEDQTLSMYSGHPMGLFPSRKDSPKCVITNGLMVSNFSKHEDWLKGYTMGTTIYGQMTAGSWAYIGPQGIVHGTFLTIANAGRKYLGLESLKGKVYISSGLGGMSGAQAKAGVICGIVTVIAEVSKEALEKRYKQGWLLEKFDDLDKLIARIKEAKKNGEGTSIGYLGNVVDLWEKLAEEKDFVPDLASDQTSCHLPYSGGYYPAGLTYEESNKMIQEDPDKFKVLVHKSLVRQFNAIQKCTNKGMKFWDYGNSFLYQCSVAGANVLNKNPKIKMDFVYPSYVEDIMGDIFSLGFGPFRWICSSNDPKDLKKTDEIAAKVIKSLIPSASKESQRQFNDNYKWIVDAMDNELVVGSQARILYSDTRGRVEIARAFNKAIKSGELSAPIIISRDHHDVSGTDSPYRETSNIKDGSYTTADMSVQTIIGNGFRGATWISLHNGGGTGWGKSSNGGFGLVVDGSKESDKDLEDMLFWDVANGLARRAWSGHKYAQQTCEELAQIKKKFNITIFNDSDNDMIEGLFEKK